MDEHAMSSVLQTNQNRYRIRSRARNHATTRPTREQSTVTATTTTHRKTSTVGGEGGQEYGSIDELCEI